MTMPAHAQPFGDRLPLESEKAAANQLRTVLAASDTTLRLLDENQKAVEITLTPELSGLLLEALRHIGSGRSVTLVPVSEMLTTQQAADILNVSRPYLVGLLEKGAIKHHKVGRHRRIQAMDLFEFKQMRDARRSAALDDLAELDADLI